MKAEKTLLTFLESRLAVHLFFCASFFIAWFLLIFVSDNSLEKLPVAALAAVYYLCACYAGRSFIKTWLTTKNFYRFSLAFLAGVVVLSVIGGFGMIVLFKRSLYDDLSKYIAVCIPMVILFMAFGMFLSAARTSVMNQIRSAKIGQVNKERELDFLRSQLTPHFLFNTLNNIYGLAITQPAVMPPLILKLSDLLRYSIYETGENFVPLNDELNYIKNYIEMESLRLGDRLTIQVRFEPSGVRIAPMLLVTFIENAFKHAANTADHDINIEISLVMKGTKLIFSIVNSCPEVYVVNFTSQNSGVGISNAKKRLELLYPGKYSLQNFKKENQYVVHLSIDLNA